MLNPKVRDNINNNIKDKYKGAT